MDGNIVALAQRLEIRQILLAEDGSATAILRVLDADDAGAGIAGPHGADCVLNPIEVKLAVAFIRNQRERHAAERRRAAGLVPEDVALVAHDDLVATPAVREQRRQVAHRATGDVEGGFFAEHLGRELFEPAHGWVLTELIVADLGIRHGLPHGRCRLGNGIAPQIDH
jgi:hypothetical protein